MMTKIVLFLSCQPLFTCLWLSWSTTTTSYALVACKLFVAHNRQNSQSAATLSSSSLHYPSRRTNEILGKWDKFKKWLFSFFAPKQLYIKKLLFRDINRWVLQHLYHVRRHYHVPVILPNLSLSFSKGLGFGIAQTQVRTPPLPIFLPLDNLR